MKIRHLIFSLPIMVILLMTLTLLTYISYGETKRTYLKFQLEKFTSQADIIKTAFDTYLQAGLPLSQFSGFASLSTALLLSDPHLENIQVIDHTENIVFFNAPPEFNTDNLRSQLSQRHYTPLIPDHKTRRPHLLEESPESYRVTLGLTSKFGIVGHVRIESQKATTFQLLNDQFRFIYLTGASLSLFCILLIILYEIYFATQQTRKKFLKIIYVTSFFSMSIVIATIVFQIYDSGAKANTKALADSMAQRLMAIVELGIDFQDIAGIHQAFRDYKSNNPDVSTIALIKDGLNYLHTQENLIGQPYQTPKGSYEHVVILGENTGHAQELRVAITTPADIVLKAIWGNAQAFIILFIACGLISLLFLNAATAMVTVVESETNPNLSPVEGQFAIGLNLIKPAYFLIVFINALSVSFLPQLTQNFVNQAPYTLLVSTSLPFTIFYACFALVLIPAGYYAEKGYLKSLMGWGFMAEVFGALTLSLTQDYWFFTFGRAISGIGQGLFLIGLQSYVLVITPPNKRTQGVAVKVIGRNAGLIAGTAIGALLFTYMGHQWLFLLAAALSLIGIVYLWFLVPEVEKIHPQKTSPASRHTDTHLFHQIIDVFKDAEFSKTFLLIGLIGKMAITGIIMFAVPLTLANLGIATETIGQALMVYYISSMIITHYASRFVDHIGVTQIILFASAIVGGIGMLLLGVIGIEHTGQLPISYFETAALLIKQQLIYWGISELYFILFCLVLTGISNGFLAAPILTHINKTEVAERHGNKSISATYTFLERGGHVMGPTAVHQLLVLVQHSTLAISIFGLITIILGFGFILVSRKK